jgi:septal ring factor EnvC (AmiA/AmiB activator)
VTGDKLKLLGLSIGVLALMVDVVWAAPSSKELEEMEKRVQDQNMEHKKLQAEAAKISLELNDVSVDMVKAAKQIQNNEEKLSKMEAELVQLREDLATAEEKFAQEDENLIRTLAALQNLAMKPTEALFVQPLTPVEIIRSAMLMRETVPYLEQNASRLRGELETIRLKKSLVEKQVKKIVSTKMSLEKEHDNLKALVQKKSKIRNAVEIKSAQTKKNVETLASQAQDLRDLLDKLDKHRKAEAEKQRKLAEQKAVEEQKIAETKKLEETRQRDLIKLKPPIINDVGEEFVKAKGNILMPARGPIVTRFNDEMSKGVKSKGIIIKTRSMAQVISPFDGSVMFAAPFRGYGNMVIIDHGKGYLSLLAGMDNVDCEVGQMLLAGEPIGLMPSDNSAKLYVEIRKDNHPVNPMAWIEN